MTALGLSEHPPILGPCDLFLGVPIQRTAPCCPPWPSASSPSCLGWSPPSKRQLTHSPALRRLLQQVCNLPRTTVVTCAYSAILRTAMPVVPAPPPRRASPHGVVLASFAAASPLAPAPFVGRDARFTVLERASPSPSARATKMKFVVPLPSRCMYLFMLLVFM